MTRLADVSVLEQIKTLEIVFTCGLRAVDERAERASERGAREEQAPSDPFSTQDRALHLT